MTAVTLPSLLVVDDEPDLRTLYELALLREGYAVDTADCVEEAWAQLQARSYGALITDMRLPDGNGLELLKRLDQAGRSERVIVITAHGSAENAVLALKAGAYDYLTKPVDLKQFRSVVAAALGRQPTPRAAPASGRPTTGSSATPALAPVSVALRRMAGESAPMQQVRALVEKVARSMAPVLIQGESGTGKELVARSIHQVSARAAMPFIAVNCGAIPEQLLEAEFFGYRKGAFSGATEDREGFFQAANGGTLFLDEIGDLPLSMQSKLLRAIQERAVRAVGAVNEVTLDVRIVSATHRDLAEDVPAGRFRQDLYYRLNVIQIRVPSLRERASDLPALCERLLERIAGETGLAQRPQLTPAALDHLARYDFPGNVRELENLLHRAVALSGSLRIEVDDLALPLGRPADAVDTAWRISAVDFDPSLLPTDGVPAESLASSGSFGTNGLPPPQPASAVPKVPTDLVGYLDEVERAVLVRALAQHRNNRTAAGAAMGLTLRQMRYRMARLGIQVASDGVVRDDADGGADPDLHAPG